MYGFAIGVVCGAVEYILLKRLTSSLLKAMTQDVILLFGLKLIVMAACFGICVFAFRDQIVHAGIGMALALVVCAVVSFVRQLISDRRAVKGD